MDQLVSEIRRHSAEGDYKTLANVIASHTDQIGQTDQTVLDAVIECLDNKKHSLGVMAFL